MTIKIGACSGYSFDRIKYGIPGLDSALDNIRVGDNVVLNVTNLNEFSYFVNPYIRQAKEDGRNLIYIRFANHPPLIEMTDEDFELLEREQNNPDKIWDNKVIHQYLPLNGDCFESIYFGIN